MRKRLRKKLRLGEFREYGFDVSYRLRDDLPESEADDFLFRFVDMAIEANSLACGGGGRSPVYEFCVVSDHRGSPTKEQHSAVGSWLGAQLEVVDHSVGAFFDAWHGAEHDDDSQASGGRMS